MEIKDLPLVFIGQGEVRGIEFAQVEANAYAYIYKRSDGVFEVFKKVVNTQFNTISYPKSKSFGKWAWCCRTLPDAMNKFDEITEKGELKPRSNSLNI